MLLAAITLALMANQAVAAIPSRPARPSDEAILQKLAETRPDAIIVDHTARDVRDDGRVICGSARHSNTIEPFAAYAVWKEASSIRVIENGRAAPVPEAHWRLSAVTPSETPDSTGDADRRKRNSNALQRRLALNFCPDIAPPDGIVWTTTQEPHPNPDRQRLIEQRARMMTDVIFGRNEEASGDQPD